LKKHLAGDHKPKGGTGSEAEKVMPLRRKSGGQNENLQKKKSHKEPKDGTGRADRQGDEGVKIRVIPGTKRGKEPQIKKLISPKKKNQKTREKGGEDAKGLPKGGRGLGVSRGVRIRKLGIKASPTRCPNSTTGGVFQGPHKVKRKLTYRDRRKRQLKSQLFFRPRTPGRNNAWYNSKLGGTEKEEGKLVWGSWRDGETGQGNTGPSNAVEETNERKEETKTINLCAPREQGGESKGRARSSPTKEWKKSTKRRWVPVNRTQKKGK